MLEDLEKLIELQRIDNKIDEIEKILSEVPDYIKEIQDEYNSINSRYELLAQEIANLKDTNSTLNKTYEEKKNYLKMLTKSFLL